jgi:hypothetical protein
MNDNGLTPMPHKLVVQAVRPQDLLDLIFWFVHLDFVQPAEGQPGPVVGSIALWSGATRTRAKAAGAEAERRQTNVDRQSYLQ